LSLISLPFLIPWQLSEKFFQFFLQPLIFRKYQIGPEKKRKLLAWLPLAVLGILLSVYLIKTASEFVQQHGTLLAAFKNGKYLVFTIYNDAVSLLNLLLSPLNTLLAFISGVEVGIRRVIFSLYLLFVMLIFIASIAVRLVTSNVSLQRAVKLRNEAVRDVNLVHFSEKAKDDEIFLGLDLSRHSKPFYLKKKWLQGHMQVIGSPGSGKSESIIQPFWFQEVRRNAPTIVLDGKASRQNIDKFFTIASSLAQGHEIIYFNPTDPERSATYNPLRRGTPAEIKNRLLSSLNWSLYSTISRERVDYYLNLILRSIKDAGTAITLNEVSQYFKSKSYVEKQLGKIKDQLAHNGLTELVNNYATFQTETAFFGELLREICQSEYGWLLDTATPELDILDVYAEKKDCYFSLPITPADAAMGYLGQLILGDILSTFHHLGMQRNGNANQLDGGLLIIDEAAKFIKPNFIELLRVSRNLGVCVCYTNQSLVELSSPELQLSKAFVDQLADQTNVTCCFHLGSAESVEAIMNRIGPEQKLESPSPAPTKESEAKKVYVVDSNFLKQLEVGRCLVFVRQPRLMGILKTGYFRFDDLLSYARQESDEKSES
jgi:hypothetical protein